MSMLEVRVWRGGTEGAYRRYSVPREDAQTVLDVGHSHGTFLTKEFGFELARRNAQPLRVTTLVLGFALPLLWLASRVASWQLGVAAALCGMIGLLAERWLFFAEARHTVRLYHGEPRT